MPLIRCQTRHNGHYCTVCGKCSCIEINEHASRVWGIRSDTCPIHGSVTGHPLRFKRATAARPEDRTAAQIVLDDWGR